MPTRCFWVEPTNTEQVSLRRYAGNSHGDCPVHGFHTAEAHVCDRPGRSVTRLIMPEHATRIEHEHGITWPTVCDCGYQFSPEDERQVSTARLFERDTGERKPLRDWEPGVMWDADWMPDCGPDGRCIVVRLPNGRDWMIDSRASNCTLPDDDEHQCWIRHGEPPNLTVDKNGNTCAAGGGSIWSAKDTDDDWHGFLTNGELTP